MRSFAATVLLFLAILVIGIPATVRAELSIDADYPGGNIVVNSIDRNTDGVAVSLCQDLRDTQGWWFYWSFRVRGAEGETLTFRFTDGNVIGTRGPALSLDAGRTWSWLGTESVDGMSFVYTVAADTPCVQFAFAPPYQESDLERFLRQHEVSKHLIVDELCRTRNHRSVERIRVGRLDGNPAHRVLLTCRHHCCESIASFALEGMLAAMLADTDDGRWFRENVEVLAIPFVDKDGVEQGDQGKNRKPHDHNRDYDGQSLYPSVAALRSFVPQWSDDRLQLALDLHCPYIRGDHNEVIYLVGNRNPEIWKQQCKLSEILESVCRGSVPYQAADNLPFGQAWNTEKNYGGGTSCSRWASELKGMRLATGIEIPYANLGETTMTPPLARSFGAKLTEALRRYLSQLD